MKMPDCFGARQYADPTVAAATIDFLNQNKTKLLVAHATLLPQVHSGPSALGMIADSWSEQWTMVWLHHSILSL